MFVAIINALFRFIENAANALLLLLPDSPFQFGNFNVPDWASWVGIFIPWEEMFVFMTAYIGAVIVYYVIRTALRWIKAVGD